jgi:hypothetical protein
MIRMGQKINPNGSLNEPFGSVGFRDQRDLAVKEYFPEGHHLGFKNALSYFGWLLDA